MKKEDLKYLKHLMECKKESLIKYSEFRKKMKNTESYDLNNIKDLVNLSVDLNGNKSLKLGYNQIFESSMKECQNRFFNEHNFYVYLGTYNCSDIEVDYNSFDADYSAYINIEMAKPYIIKVNIKKRNDFEKHKHILYRGIDEEAYTKSNMDYYHFVREIYYLDAIEKGENIAAKNIYKRIKKHSK